MVVDMSRVAAATDDGVNEVAATRPQRVATQHERVAVLGLGYVGLPTCIALSRAGYDVSGIDTNVDRICDVEALRVDLLDADRELLRQAIERAAISFSSTPDAVRDADVVFICVPTPVDRHRVPVLDAVACACATAVENARVGQTFILTSTSFAGTTRRFLIEPLTHEGLVVGHDVHVAFAPERVDPGNTRFPQTTVPRIIGGATQQCSERAAAVLAPIAASVHVVDSPETAELAKLFENTFRAVNIALVNELAEICDRLGVNPCTVVDAAATKPYGFMPFYPGPGVGGHCIPVDPHYLLWQVRELGVNTPIIDDAMAAIAQRPRRMVEHIARALSDRGRAVRGAQVLLVGLAYKPDVQDLRGSPALEIADELVARGASVAFHDPLVEGQAACAHLVADAAPDPDRYDLVVVHTLHKTVDYGWLRDAPRLLDCTYRMATARDRAPAMQLRDGLTLTVHPATAATVAPQTDAGKPAARMNGRIDTTDATTVDDRGTAHAADAPPIVAPAAASMWARASKRALDIAVSSCLLLITAPLMLVVAIAIKIDSTGPVIYRCPRVGHRGREFRMLKFRKMHVDARGPGLTVSDDDRFTRIGRFLARSKLDELPQLWNVLRGDMSLVGPRPESPEFVACDPRSFAAVLDRVRPGITGPSQLAFARESEILAKHGANRREYYVSHLLPAKLALDAKYASAIGLRRDLAILWWTAVAMVLRSPLAVDRSTNRIRVRHRSDTASAVL